MALSNDDSTTKIILVITVIGSYDAFKGYVTNIQNHVLTYQTTTTATVYGPWTLSGTTQVSWYQKDKTNLDLLQQETVSGSGIRWAICKSALCPRQITTPASHHSVFLQAGCPSCHPTNSIKALTYQSEKRNSILYVSGTVLLMNLFCLFHFPLQMK